MEWWEREGGAYSAYSLQQLAVVAQFREGVHNVLVATSVGEEVGRLLRDSLFALVHL